jgi:hypothetical protein
MEIGMIALWLGKEKAIDKKISKKKVKNEVPKSQRFGYTCLLSALSMTREDGGFILSLVQINDVDKQYQFLNNLVHSWDVKYLDHIDLKPILEKYTGKSFNKISEYRKELDKIVFERFHRRWFIMEKQNLELTDIVLEKFSHPEKEKLRDGDFVGLQRPFKGKLVDISSEEIRTTKWEDIV